jgi:lipid II:glycine glycyltransferase (peptidoglycan interpeptide bridge formation enzyme)
MRPAGADEMARWNELIAANPDGGNVLQVKAFARTKARHGWRPRYFVLRDAAVLVLARALPGLGEFWYVPAGPGVRDVAGLTAFAAAIPVPGPFVMRVDPLLPGGAASEELAAAGFVRTRDIQYNTSTVVVDLTPPEEAILASFKQKTRYNVRLAGKKGVVCAPVPTTQDNAGIFYELAQATYRRAGVYVRSRRYFEDFWRLHSAEGTGQMFFASYEGQVLGAAFITFVGARALYKDGASSREHPELQAMSGLQWAVMRWLKARGIAAYDLHGVPPAGQLEDPDHPLAGLARFKMGFQQTVTEYIGTYDIVCDARAYRVWRRFGERIAMAYEHRVRKRLFY